jgi:ribosomal protein S18 acetylase RimI-like enzyme
MLEFNLRLLPTNCLTRANGDGVSEPAATMLRVVRHRRRWLGLNHGEESMGVEIRAMAADDLDAVIALWQSTPGIGLNESDSASQLRLFLARNPGLSLVAEDGRRIVAAVLCGHDGRRGCLYHLAVIPEYRQRGFGTQLVDRCLAGLAAEGVLKCNALVYADNDGAQQFWHRGGWSHRSELILMQVPIEIE